MKEFLNGLGIIGFMMFLIPFGLILLETPFLSSLKNPVPAKLPALTTGKRKFNFALNIILGAAIPAILLMPVMLLNTKVFPDASTQNTTTFFPQPSTNQIMLWVTVVGIIALALFFLNYFLIGKKEGVTPIQWGIRIGLGNLLKTVFLAGIVVVVAYNLVDWADFFFKTDFRFWTIAIKKFDSPKFCIMLHYLPFFFLFFFANSLTINGLNRVAGQKEWVNTAFSWLQVLGGIIVVIAIQYIVLFSRGEAVWHPNLSWICILLTFPMILQLTLSTIASRIFFEKTGNIYLASFVNAIFITMMVVANTCTISKLV